MMMTMLLLNVCQRTSKHSEANAFIMMTMATTRLNPDETMDKNYNKNTLASTIDVQVIGESYGHKNVKCCCVLTTITTTKRYNIIKGMQKCMLDSGFLRWILDI